MVRLSLKIKKHKLKKEKEETIEKYRLSQGRMNNYKKEVKDRLTEKEDIDIMTINKIMKESAEKQLKVKTAKIKIAKEKAEEKDKKWMTEQIRKKIMKRKELNRQQRNENREREKHLIWERYKEQKIKVRELIKKEIRKHEKKLLKKLNKIREGRSFGKI